MITDYDFAPGRPRRQGERGNFVSGRAGTREELFDLAEEPGRFRMSILGRQSLELIQQLALSLGQLLRRLDQDLDIHIAVLLRPQHRHPFTLKPEAPSRWVAFRPLPARVVAVDGRDLEL